MRSTKEIGVFVRQERKAQGISQEQLAGVAGTGTRFVSELEHGKETIQADKMIKVVEALGYGIYVMNRWEAK
ncbi:MAG: helix-turn-helix transcriptional regulator [Akkermansia sp.]|nr:helix-turn-helix transcriptional regulator [Akkermansia sp.]